MLTSMLPRTALEYGQILCAASTSACARLRSTPDVHVEARAQEVLAVGKVHIHLGIDRGIWRQRDLLLAGGKRHGALEAGRPASSEKLLGIGAGARRAGTREFDIKPTVDAARCAVAPAHRVGLRGVDESLMARHGRGHGGLPR